MIFLEKILKIIEQLINLSIQAITSQVSLKIERNMFIGVTTAKGWVTQFLQMKCHFSHKLLYIPLKMDRRLHGTQESYIQR